MHSTTRTALFQPAFRQKPSCVWCRFFTIAARRHGPAGGQWGSMRPPKRRTDIQKEEQTQSSPPQSPIPDLLPQKSSSLFHELFPNIEAVSEQEQEQRPERGYRKRMTEGAAVAAAASRHGELWREESISKDDLRSWLEAHASEEDDALPDKEQMPAMLVLINASRSLAESDFHRIGQQGQHLQGWNGPIKEVIQAYDRNTLEPLGCYFILFASKAAARAYQTEAERIHWPLRSAQTFSLPSYTPPGEPDSSSPPAFTLSSSPLAPLGLKLHSLPPSTAARLKAFTLEGILSTATPMPVNDETGQVPLPKQSPDQHRVILSLDNGAMALHTLQDFLRQDGETRRLAWDVTNVAPYLPQKLDAVGRRNGQKQQKQTKLAEETQQGGTDQAREDCAGAGGEGGEESPGKTDGPLKSGRFVLTFGDVHEARRFVRGWHRREFELPRLTGDAEDHVQASSGARQCVTVNAMLPW